MNKHNILYATFICCIASLSGVMLGYDASVISGVIEPLTKHFTLSPAESGWAVSNVLFGCIFGAWIVGAISNKYGRKVTLIFAAILFLISAVGSALATNFFWFVVYRMIGGFAVGMASAITPLYIAEVSPRDYRGRMLGLQQLLMVGGQLVVYIVNYGIVRGMDPEWVTSLGWRWMLASEMVPIAMFLILVFFMPESPRWYAMVNKDKKALGVLSRLSNLDHAKQLLSEIKESINLEQAQEKVSLDARQILTNPKTRFIVLIGCVIATLQQLIGINILLYYAPSLLKNINADIQDSLFQSIFLGAANFFGVSIALFLVDKVGRKPLLKFGTIGCAICLVLTSAAFVMGIKGYFPVVTLVLFVFIFGLTWSLGAWLIMSEIFPNRMRAVGMGIAFSAMYISNFAVTQSFPMMNRSDYLMEKFNGSFPLIMCAVFCIVGFWFVGRFLPETRGVSLEKIEPLMLSRSKRFREEAEKEKSEKQSEVVMN
ncbi:sugar porter family MFS transporter [Vibrio salinus]|uniref:sugar porter family MFS transporter n=1 Tax=Vibrio salinus TaxID=2899784 RepID=UPI001E622360|nr:sugar porter family MFS transporter [Vibrio salinus]MCE0495297.1 sugar porter family MFS transporter [Vibrio salinus]